ncbi:MAG: TetR family transcriptional regulator [Sandaracinaceae bacterium]|nr:TetR family transcriptional regulator [Sandaracinaceae bacterium]
MADARRAEEALKTREALVDAAAELFAEQGLTGPSLDAICAKAGFTRGAFYVHFATRDDLIAAVVEKIHGRLHRRRDRQRGGGRRSRDHRAHLRRRRAERRLPLPRARTRPPDPRGVHALADAAREVPRAARCARASGSRPPSAAGSGPAPSAATWIPQASRSCSSRWCSGWRSRPSSACPTTPTA